MPIQHRQLSDQLAIFIARPSPFATRLLDQYQNRTQPIHQAQQSADQIRVHRKPSVPQRSQQMLAGMPNLFGMTSGDNEFGAMGGGGWPWILSDLKTLLETGSAFPKG